MFQNLSKIKVSKSLFLGAGITPSLGWGRNNALSFSKSQK